MPSPSDALRRGRRALEDRASVNVIEDWKWYADIKRWGIHLSLLQSGLSKIPERTDWIVFCDRSYPYGTIDVYPSSTEHGISTTFPHQECNQLIPGLPWRAGKICLSDPIASLGRTAPLSEPFDPDGRLLWHIDRLTSWVKAAETNKLQNVGDHFESPHFPCLGERQLGFAETEASFAAWTGTDAVEGTAELGTLNRDMLVTLSFRANGISWKQNVEWGQLIGSLGKRSRAIWMRLPSIPLVQDWTVPNTWGELEEACRKMGVDLFASLKRIAKYIRDGEAHLLLIGFPIPVLHGEPAQRLLWQALEIPTLSYGKKTEPGFRTNDDGYWRRDTQLILRSEIPLRWIRSTNWNHDIVQARGKMGEQLIDKRVAIIGCGSLGSCIAELLVRLGLRNITLLDGDKLTAPNLLRHTLSLEEVGQNKAIALARHLNSINPFCSAMHLAEDLDADNVTNEAISDADVIIDCTADDGVLQTLSSHEFGSTKQFVSISMAYGAQRLYCYQASGNLFPLKDFNDKTQPSLKLDAEDRAGKDLQWEAPGCWHPLFPARLDDVFLLAAMAVKWIERHAADQDSIFQAISLPTTEPAQALLTK